MYPQIRATRNGPEPAEAAGLAGAPQPAPTLDLTARDVEILREAVAYARKGAAVPAATAAELQTLERRLDTTVPTTVRVDAPASGATSGPDGSSADGPAAPAGRALGADRPAIQSGYPVFARPADPADDVDIGQFVGVVDEVIESRGAPYLHVRGGLEQVRDLFLPFGAVRAAVGHQVRLNLTPADLIGQSWHTPPMLRAG